VRHAHRRLHIARALGVLRRAAILVVLPTFVVSCAQPPTVNSLNVQYYASFIEAASGGWSAVPAASQTNEHVVLTFECGVADSQLGIVTISELDGTVHQYVAVTASGYQPSEQSKWLSLGCVGVDAQSAAVSEIGSLVWFSDTSGERLTMSGLSWLGGKPVSYRRGAAH